MEDLAEIYGDGGKIEKWSQLGVSQHGLPGDEIIRVGRQNNSGTYAYFREAVLGTQARVQAGLDRSERLEGRGRAGRRARRAPSATAAWATRCPR